VNISYKNLFIGIVCLLLLQGCISFNPKHISYQDFGSKPNDTFRIASYNIDWGDSGWPHNNRLETIHAIKIVNADVILFQESSRSWKKILLRELGQQYPYYIFEQVEGRGIAILSKFPITTKKYLTSSSGWYPAWVGEVDTKWGKFSLANFYLIPTILSKDAPKHIKPYSIWEAQSIRTQQINEYFLQLKDDLPLIIAGDFNQDTRGVDDDMFKELGFGKAESYLQEPINTWYWPVGPFYVVDYFDHVYYQTSEFKVVNVQVLQEGASDHFPIVVDFVFMDHHSK